MTICAEPNILHPGPGTSFYLQNLLKSFHFAKGLCSKLRKIRPYVNTHVNCPAALPSNQKPDLIIVNRQSNIYSEIPDIYNSIADISKH